MQTVRENPNSFRAGDTQGSVLILALWTLVLLSALALAVAARVRGAITLASVLKSDTDALYAARSGVELCISAVSADSNEWDAVTEDWSHNEELFREFPSGNGGFSSEYLLDWGKDGTVERYGLIDEESRININSPKYANEAVLNAALRTIGGVDELRAGRMAAAIMDWRDADDQPLTDGAESSYYQARGKPYKCGNGPFGTIEELLLVRGMENDIFQELKPHITVHGAGPVNINTCGHKALRAIAVAVVSVGAGDGAELVDKIIAFRKSGRVFEKAEYQHIKDKLDKGTGLSPGEAKTLNRMMPYMSVRSTCFGGTVSGYARRDSGGGRSLSGKREPGKKITFVYDRKKGRLVFLREH